MAEPEFTPDELATEEWRNVIDYEGTYSVSNLGRLRRDAPRQQPGWGGPCQVGRIMKPTVMPSGYFYTNLCLNGRKKQHRIHRLLAAAFIGPCPISYECNHKDGNKANNRLSNIEYVTSSANKLHAVALGLARGSIRMPNSRRPPRHCARPQ